MTMQADKTIAAPSLLSAPARSDAVRHWGLWVTAITALGLLLRAAAINKDSFWYDEVVASNLSASPVGALFSGAAKDAGNPPLYWAILHLWSLVAGSSEAALRATSVIFGTLAIPVLAALGRRLLGSMPGMVAAGLWALSPLALELADEARPYALLHLMAIVCTLLFVRWVQDRKKFDLALYALATSVLCYTHYYGFAVPFVHGLVVLLLRDRKKLILPWLGAMVIAALIWLPWLPQLRDQVRPGNTSRMGDRWQLQFMVTPIAFALGRTFAWRDSSKVMLAAAMGLSAIGFWIPALWGAVSLWRAPATPSDTRSPDTARWLLPLWLLCPILGPLVVAILLSPIYHHRYASVGMPAFVLLAAFGFSRFPKFLATGIAAIVLLSTGVAVANYYREPLKDDWRSATPALLSRVHPGDAVIIDTMDEVTTFKYYVPSPDKMPAQIIGINSAPKADVIKGVKFDHGTRLDKLAADYTDAIFVPTDAWVVLCVPNATAADYKAIFADKGSTLVDTLHFQRIDILHFERKAP